MVNMAVLGGRAVGVSSFPSHSYFSRNVKATSPIFQLHMLCSSATSRGCIACSAVQETSTSAVAAETKEVKTAEKEAPAKPIPAARASKAPAKPLPQLMEEDVIPPLKAILEARDDLFNVELSFRDDKLEGSLLKKGNTYSFWAFFPSGVLTGPKGFALSSFGQGASTVEPFLIDEKRITGKLVVFGLKSAWRLRESFPSGENDPIDC